MNKLKTEKRVRIAQCLVEGVGINATCRLVGVHKDAVLKLLNDLGCACAAYHNDHVHGLKPKRVECDEIWGFCGMKQKNVPEEKLGVFGCGDVWLWTCVDPDTKLMIGYHVGLRTPDDANEFMLDLSGRINNITQISTDGLGSYPDTIRAAFGNMVHFAQLIKVFKTERPDHARYSPASCVGCQKKIVIGRPISEHISTSIVERSNLTIRMGMRRYTRLTNAHSKKIENHGHAIALFFAYYNYCRPHSSLERKTTPAMAAELADHVWTLEELIGLIK